MGLFDGKKFDLQSTVGKIQGKIADITQATETTGAHTDKSVHENTEKVTFCSSCGTKLNAGAKFCHGCGANIGTASSPTTLQTPPDLPQDNYAERKQEYAGTILKCPNCGAAITQTTAICPDCGYRITGQTTVSSIRVFNEQLMSIEATRKKPGLGSVFGVSVDPADQKKLSLIRSFPIPNGIDDIVEFMMLATANIDIGLSKNTVMNRYQGAAKSGESNLTMPKTISDAWVQKMQQAYQKAQMTFPNDSAFLTIQQIYLDKMKELKIKIK